MEEAKDFNVLYFPKRKIGDGVVVTLSWVGKDSYSSAMKLIMDDYDRGFGDLNPRRVIRQDFPNDFLFVFVTESGERRTLHYWIETQYKNPDYMGGVQFVSAQVHKVVTELDGMDIRDGIPEELLDYMKKNGLCVVYGHSDDCMEIEGSFDDEFYGKVWWDKEKRTFTEEYPDPRTCPQYVEPVFFYDEEWTMVFRTNFTDAGSFRVYDDGEPYCIGRCIRLYDKVQEEGDLKDD